MYPNGPTTPITLSGALEAASEAHTALLDLTLSTHTSYPEFAKSAENYRLHLLTVLGYVSAMGPPIGPKDLEGCRDD